MLPPKSTRTTTRILLVMLATVVAITGCSRLTFVRPKYDQRKGPEMVARKVQASDKRAGVAGTRAHLQQAQQRLVAGDYAGAEREAQQALKLDPKSVDAHTLLAAALERSGNTAKAGEHYRRATELAPANGSALNNYGTWLCSSGRAAESLEWFNRAVATAGYSTPAAALANAGACADQAGQGDLAERNLRRAIEMDPGNAVALGVLAEREFRAGRAFEARAFSERRLAAAPADARALLLASQIEQKLGDTAAAARYVQRLRAEFPGANEARNFETGDGGRR